MKKLEEITREDFEKFKFHKTKIEYTQPEGMDLVNLVRTYINDRQASCFSCGSALRDAKTAANEFYYAFGEQMEAIVLEKEMNKQIIIPINNGKKGKNK